MGGRCAHFSNYMGPWCLTNSDYIGGGVRPISNSVGGCIAFAASRRGKKNIICKSPCCALFVFRDALPFCQLECPLSVKLTRIYVYCHGEFMHVCQLSVTIITETNHRASHCVPLTVITV